MPAAEERETESCSPTMGGGQQIELYACCMRDTEHPRSERSNPMMHDEKTELVTESRDKLRDFYAGN
jgi:hypothetical protein